MAAALTCFRRRGFHQATMQEICATAEISAGSLYHYFASKAEIIGAIAEAGREGADAAFQRAAEQTGVIDAMCEVAGEYFSKVTVAGEGALIADIMAELIRDDVISSQLRKADADSVHKMAAALRTAQKRGDIDASLDVEAATDTILATIEGIGLRRAFLRDPDSTIAETQFRAFLERYLGRSQ